jgi:hypothetical protein
MTTTAETKPPPATAAPDQPAAATPGKTHLRSRRRWWLWIVAGLAIAFVLIKGVPSLLQSWGTVSPTMPT